MNTPATANANVDFKCSPHLLNTVLKYRVDSGLGLTDEEFTRFVRERNLPVECGFSFLCYCNGYVTLSVPQPQKESDWSDENGRLTHAKENTARAIAQKHSLVLFEPPDLAPCWCHLPNPHHHVQLHNRQGPVIIAHPQYAKVRLIEPTGQTRLGSVSQRAVALGPDLLSELAELYRS